MSFVDDDFIPDSGALFNFGEIGSDELISKIWINNDAIKEVCCGDDFIVFITCSGRVFSYGKNDWGQLGYGNTIGTVNPCCIKSLQSLNEKAVLVACGRCHTLLFTENQKLYAFGSNTDGQLGLDNSLQSVTEPTEVTSWNGGIIKQLSAGGEFSAALTENGNFYVWGSNSEGQLGLNNVDYNEVCQPTQLKFFSSPVTSMCCGAYHMGAISANVLYMWGEASDGKLGLGDSVKENQNFPQRVRLDIAVKQLTCGNNHSACLTMSGDVFVWGQGESGQIGLGPTEAFVSTPTKLKLPNRIMSAYGDNGILMGKFVKVSAGERHTAVINANGLTFAFGDGRHGKLGNSGGSNSYNNQMWPTLMERLSKDLWTVDVDCGGCHTVVLVRHRHTDEQLDGFNSSNLSSTNQSINESTMQENNTSRVRRHRKNDSIKENNDDDNTLPTLKASIISQTNGGNENHKKRKDSSDNIEEEISDVKSSLLKSMPSERTDSDITSSNADDFEKVQAEMRKFVNSQRPSQDISSRRESLNEKVDAFSTLMDSTYKDSVPNNQEESPDEIIRKRQRKKRKIKAVQSKQDPIVEFDPSSVGNHDVNSDNEAENKRDKPIIDDGVANPDVAKTGCQPGCKGKQTSGACSVL